MPDEQSPDDRYEGAYDTTKNSSRIYTVAFQTLGCKVNRYETDALREAFHAAGFIEADAMECTDVVVVNTCTVTAEADRKSRQAVRRAGRIHPGAIVVAAGCQVAIRGGNNDATVSVGNVGKKDIVERVLGMLRERSAEGVLPTRTSQSDVPTTVSEYEDFGPVVSQEETRAYIKIQDGCNSFCSYCIIPYARGRSRSRAHDSIIEEASSLARNGFLEVVITGIHICSYMKEQNGGIADLFLLLRDIAKIDGIRRVRLGSLEPAALEEEFIRSISGIKKLCPHFHLSLQSGSDSVLRRMNRHYDADTYRKAVETLRYFFPSASLTTDIIVGFPGETDTEHRESLRFCEEMRFSKIHVFPFSERQGTKAAGMEPKVPQQEKNSRTEEFLRLSQRLGRSFREKMIGEKAEILVESTHLSGEATGYTDNYIRVRVKNAVNLAPNTMATVKITAAGDEDVTGELILL